MVQQCPACSRAGPSEAGFCYYDGTALSNGHPQGPLNVGSQTFPTPFYFADGQTCHNFNQLALTCDERWDQARDLLVKGLWPLFFASIGRPDLAAIAKHAAGESDSDYGLSLLLERMPADPRTLRPPFLKLETNEFYIGPIQPGTNRSFELVIRNQGMFVLRGLISANSDWLILGAQAGNAQVMFQTRSIYTTTVKVIGKDLRAGRKPSRGEIVIDSNGGTITVPVYVDIPIIPFPKGEYASDVLAGARSPQEIAQKAKASPNEAAVLFEQGAVKAWYAKNGWTYPIEGTQTSGKSAIQQFYEALGLSKPPPLQISATSFQFTGAAGETLSARVTVSTPESKYVYAAAFSDQDWLQIGPSKNLGNKVVLPFDVVVPARPGESVSAQMTIRSNGKQQFTVTVQVDVMPGLLTQWLGGLPDIASGSKAEASAEVNWTLWLLGGCLALAFLIILVALMIGLAVLILQ